MAIEKVELVAKFKKPGGSYITVGGTTSPTGEGATFDAAQTQIKGKIESAITAQQGVLDDLNDANAVT